MNKTELVAAVAEKSGLERKECEKAVNAVFDTITDIKFNTFGCGSAIATSSMATEMIKGKTISEALELSNKAVVEALDGLPTHKIHCSVLAEQAVRAAVKDYYDKKGIAYDPEDFREMDDEELHEHC